MINRRQGLAVYTGIMLFIGTVVVIQLWLLAAAVDALEGNEKSVLLPAAIASWLLFLLCLGLLLQGRTVERRARRDADTP